MVLVFLVSRSERLHSFQLEFDDELSIRDRLIHLLNLVEDGLFLFEQGVAWFGT